MVHQIEADGAKLFTVELPAKHGAGPSDEIHQPRPQRVVLSHGDGSVEPRPVEVKSVMAIRLAATIYVLAVAEKYKRTAAGRFNFNF
jgi:hypothetical protein